MPGPLHRAPARLSPAPRPLPLAPRWPSQDRPHCTTSMLACKPDSSCGPCSRGARVWLNPAVAESDCCPAAVAPPPIPQTLRRRPRFTARSAPGGRRLHPLPCCEPAGRTRGRCQSDAGSERTRCANAPPPPHPPAWTSCPKAGAGIGAPVHARGRASGRTQTAVCVSPCGVRRALWGEVFLQQGCAGSFSGKSRTIRSWYKMELKTRAVCMGPH